MNAICGMVMILVFVAGTMVGCDGFCVCCAIKKRISDRAVKPKK